MRATIEINSRGASGNIYHIMGMVKRVMTNAGQEEQFSTLSDSVYSSKSYASAIEQIRKFVNLKDLDEVI